MRNRVIAASLGTIILGIALSVRFTWMRQAFDWYTALPLLAIVILFWHGIFLVLSRARRLGDMQKLAGAGVLDRLLDYLPRGYAPDAILRCAGSLEELPHWRESVPVRRVIAILKQWAIRPDLQEVDLVLQQQIVQDEESVARGYNLVRTIIWSLPVLGLIGTVIGISLATGGFANFLKGNVEDVVVIKNSLVGVTSGLSYAFLLTLAGLAGSLITMLYASSCQAREERFYAAEQSAIMNGFLPTLQIEAAPPAIASVAGEAGDFQEAFREAARVATDGFERVMRGVTEEMQRRTTEQINAMQAASGALDSLSEHIERLARTTEDVLSAQSDLQSAMTQMRESGFTQTLDGLRTSLDALCPVLQRLAEPMELRLVPSRAAVMGSTNSSI